MLSRTMSRIDAIKQSLEQAVPVHPPPQIHAEEVRGDECTRPHPRHSAPRRRSNRIGLETTSPDGSDSRVNKPASSFNSPPFPQSERARPFSPPCCTSRFFHFQGNHRCRCTSPTHQEGLDTRSSISPSMLCISRLRARRGALARER